MKTLEIGNKKVECADDWDELSIKQAQRILYFADRFHRQKIEYNVFLLRSLFTILGIKRNLRAIWKENFRARYLQIKKLDNYRLLIDALTGFILKIKDGQVSLDYTATNNHFPELRLRFARYYGPEDLIANISFDQFRSASNYINEYQEDNDEHYLWLAFASLYLRARPFLFLRKLFPGYSGIKTLSFNDRTVKRKAKLFKRTIPAYKRNAVISMFENSARYIMSEDLVIDGNTVNLSPLFKQDESKSPGIGLLSILYGVADGNAFGNVDQAGRRSFLDILLYLYNSHLMAEKSKPKSNNNE